MTFIKLIELLPNSNNLKILRKNTFGQIERKCLFGRFGAGVGMCGTQEPMGSGVPGGTQPNFKNLGSGGFRVPGKLGQSGFRWVPGSDQIFSCADP